MTTEEVEDFLAHYGVAGMKWGVRKAPSARQVANEKKYGGKDKKARTAAQKRARSARNIKRVNNAIGVAAGALFVAGLVSDLGKSGATRPPPRMGNYSKPSNSVSDLINKERGVKVDAINKTFQEGFIDEAQRNQFVNAMNKRYDRKITDLLNV